MSSSWEPQAARLPQLSATGTTRGRGRRVHGDHDPVHRRPPTPRAWRGPGTNGIPIHDESELTDLIRDRKVDEVVFAYSDVSHEHVMHKASEALAAGATFSLLGPNETC